MVTRAARAPVTSGRNVNRIVQVAPGANTAGFIGQLLVSTKSWGLAPPSAIPVIVSAVPVLDTNISCSTPALPIRCGPKFAWFEDNRPVPSAVALCETELFAAFGSGTPELMLAELVTAPATLGVTTIVIVALAPWERVAAVQVTLDVPTIQAKIAPGLIDTNVLLAGSVSVNTTFGASFGPELVTCKV